MTLLTKLSSIDYELSSRLTAKKNRIFKRFYDKTPKNVLISSSASESLNAIVSKHRTEELILIFNLLEEIGFNRCLDLIQINQEYTPYYEKK